MTSLFGMLQDLAGGQTAEISRQLGADEAKTGAAVAAALPLLLGALQRNASREEGAAALLGALERDHDGSALDDVAGLVKDPAAGNGDGILKHVFGARRSAVEQGIGASSGLDAGQAGTLLTMLAPMVMGALGKTRRERGLDAGGVSQLLAGERQSAEAAAPQLSGLAAQLLDQEGDGIGLDDVAQIGKSFLGRMLDRR